MATQRQEPRVRFYKSRTGQDTQTSIVTTLEEIQKLCSTLYSHICHSVNPETNYHPATCRKKRKKKKKKKERRKLERKEERKKRTRSVQDCICVLGKACMCPSRLTEMFPITFAFETLSSDRCSCRRWHFLVLSR